MEISPIYHNSRPEGKLPAQEAAAFDFLDSLGIDYERVTHELADTMEKCDDVSAVLGVDVCKNLFLCNRQKTNFYLLCMPPHKAFHTKDLSHQIGSARLSFAPEEQLWDLLHCTPGSATILGLMNDDETACSCSSTRRPMSGVLLLPPVSLHLDHQAQNERRQKYAAAESAPRAHRRGAVRGKIKQKRFRRDFFGTFYMSSFTVRYIGLSTSASEQVQTPAV